jgi:hypothetical protein
MTIEEKILRDLAAGQSTASSLAPRCGITIRAAETVLVKLIKDERVVSHTLGGGKKAGTQVYRLPKNQPIG